MSTPVADASSVPGTNLFPDESEFTPRPAWQVIEAARRQYLTGELTLHTAPTTRIYLRDGVVYFAERSTDGTLAIRLMMEGVITREQMQRGTVIVNGVEHVGRMFDADPTIDRASVELCTELFTDDVMVDVANRQVKGYELALYRRHSSGIDRWYPHSIPVAGRQSDSTSEPEAAPQPAVAAQPEVVTQPEVVAHPAPVAAAAAPITEVVPVTEAWLDAPVQPKNKLDAPPITQAVPVIQAAKGTTPTPPPPMVTQQLPITSPPAPAIQRPPAPPSDSASDVDASTIADEVAEAIKRAFAGLGA